MVRKKKKKIKVLKTKTKRTIINLSTCPSNKSNNLFFVLDEDPIEAARSLIFKHIPLYSRIIAESFTFKYMIDNDILKEQTLVNYYKFKPKPFIYRTPYNIIFFSKMYEELCKLYKAYTGSQLVKVHRFDEEDMLFNINIATFPNDKKTNLYLPDYLSDIKKKKSFKKYNILGIDHVSNSGIDLHRLMYIIDGYPLSDFPCGAPAWYSPMSREIYRKYDRLSKKTFIIQTDTEGKYRFYYQVISGTLIEITKIEDMRELIDSFLYKV